MTFSYYEYFRHILSFVHWLTLGFSRIFVLSIEAAIQASWQRGSLVLLYWRATIDRPQANQGVWSVALVINGEIGKCFLC